MLKRNEFFAINTLLKILFFVLYFYLFAFLPNDLFRDRDVYSTLYAENSGIVFESYSYLSIFNEPLFLGFNYTLHDVLGYSGEEIVHIFVYFILLSILFFLFKESKNALVYFLSLLILFFCFYLFHLQFVVLRQALATVFFVYALLFLKESSFKILFILFLCCLIHNSFFIISILYLIYYFFCKSQKYYLMYFFTFLFSFLFSLIIFAIGRYFGVRQIEDNSFNSNMLNVGGGGFLLSLLIFIYLYFFYNSKKDSIYYLSLIFLINYCVSYYFSPVSGRLMSTFMLIVLIALVRSSRVTNIVVLLLLFIVFLIQALSGAIEGMSLYVSLAEFFEILRK